MGGDFGVEGIECHLKVVRKLLESLLVIGGCGVGHLVIPHLSEGCTTTFTHLVEYSHDLVIVRGVKGIVEDEVSLHGFDPLGSVRAFS